MHGKTADKTVKEKDSFQATEMKETARKSEIELIDENENLLKKTIPESEVEKDESIAEAKSMEETDNKKVLLRERKRRTVRRVASARYAAV